MNTAFTIAIDGPAAAGEGAISNAIAEYVVFAHLLFCPVSHLALLQDWLVETVPVRPKRIFN